MTEVIAFPLIEKIVVSHLATALTDTYVSTKIPNPRTASMIRVTRVGGPRANLVSDKAMVLIECWANDTIDAAQLARLARAHVWAMPGQTIAGAWVRACTEVGGPQNYPDPETSMPRYQFTVQLNVRGEVIP